jgi:hypothetical protein
VWVFNFIAKHPLCLATIPSAGNGRLTLQHAPVAFAASA